MTGNLKKAKETGEIVTQEASVLDVSGNELWYHSTIVPVYNDKNELDYLLVISIEITARKQAEAQLLRRTQEANTLRQAAASLASSLDLAQVLDNILSQLAQVVAYDSATVFLTDEGQLRVVAGRGLPHLREVLGQVFPTDNELFLETQKTGRPLVIPDAQQDPRFDRWGGADYIHGWMGLPLIVGGEMIGRLTIDSRTVGAYDETQAELALAFANQAAIALHNARLYEQAQKEIDERQRVAARLLQANERLALAQRSAGAGLWSWDLATGVLDWSPELFSLFGIDPATPPTFEVWRAVIHPEDRESAEKQVDDALRERLPLQNEYRIVLPSGEVRWIYALGNIVHSDQNEPQRMSGICLDITVRKRFEEALQKSEEKYRTVAEFTYDWETWRGPSGDYLYISPSCERISGHTAEEFLADSQLVTEIAHPEDRQAVLEHLELTNSQDSEPALQLEFRILTPQGETRWINHVCATVHGENGQWLGRRGSNRDITERKQAEARRQKLQQNLGALWSLAKNQDEDLKVLTNYVLEEIKAITESEYAFYGFINEAETEMRIFSWSKEAMEACRIDDKTIVYPIGEAGIWGEAVRKRENVVVNNYAVDFAGKRGLPAGHIPLTRLAAVPIFDGGRIVAVGVVANKPSDYSAEDLQQLEAFLSNAQLITKRKRAEDAMRQSEEKYRKLFSEMSSGCSLQEIICDQQGQPVDYVTLDVNTAFESLLDVPREAVIGGKASSVLPPEELQHWLGVFGPVALTGQSTRYEMYSPLNQKYFEGVVYSPEHGKFAVVFADVTARKQTEQALRESEEKYRSLYREAALGIFHSSFAGKFLDLNPALARMLGYASPEEVLASVDNIAEQIYAEPPKRDAFVQQMLASGEVIHVENLYRRKDGSVWNSLLHLRLVSDAQGQPSHLEGFVEDITERKQAEQALRESEERYRRLTGAITDYIYTVQVKDGQALETRHGPGCVAVTGYTPEEFAADPYLWYRMIWPEDRDLLQDDVQELLAGREVFREHRITRKDGQLRWIRDTLSPHFNERRELVSYDGLVQDITARKQAEELRRKSEEKFSIAFQISPDAITIVSMEDGKYLDVNQAFFNVTGFQPEEVIGHTSTEIGVWIEADDRRRYIEALNKNDSLRNFETRYRMRNGEIRLFSVSSETIELEGKKCSLNYITDITEQKRAEEALRLSEANLNKAQHFAHLGSWIWHIQTDHLEWSDEMYNIFEVDKATFSGSLPEVIAQAIHPDDRAKVEASNSSVINQGKPIPLDYRILRSDGSIRTVWAEAGELGRDEAGRPSLLSGIVQDITERKQMEEDLRASLAEKETLLREVHHRVKNNLQVISSLLSMQADSSQNELVTKALDESKNRVRSMALIHEKLYRSKNLEYIQAEEYISELLDNLRSSFAGQTRNVSFDVQVASLNFNIDKAIPCGMIISELISNALKYAFPDGAGGLVKVYLEIVAGKARLTLSDNGVGLPDKIDILHPETLGLELVSILAHQLKASLEVIRQPGTTYLITFEP